MNGLGNRATQSESLNVKLLKIYIPYIVVSVCTIFGYTFLIWLFNDHFGLLNLKTDVINFWLPFLLPWFPVFYSLRRRIYMLDVAGKRDNGHFLYQFIFAVSIAIPTLIAQDYVSKALYNLVNIDLPSHVEIDTREKYFKFQEFDVDKSKCWSHANFRMTGKHNQNLNFYLFSVCPFYNTNNLVWYGIESRRQISNRKSEEEKDSAYRGFVSESLRKLEQYQFQNAEYFEKVAHSDELDGYMLAVTKNGKREIEGNVLVLAPVQEAFSDRLGNSFFSFVFGFVAAAFVVLLMVLIPSLKENAYKKFVQGKQDKDKEVKDFLSVLNPFVSYKVTSAIIWLNVCVFVVMVFMGVSPISPTGKELFMFGANSRIEVLNGEYWRLISSIFIHAGVMHLAVNLVGLMISGFYLDAVLGIWRTIFLYLLCGLVASVTSIAWREHGVSVGASGAILGLYGIIMVFSIAKIYPVGVRGAAWAIVGIYAGIGVLFGFLVGADNAAHIGGFLAGIISGTILVILEKNKLEMNAKRTI